jgi:hypothetical protein
MDRGRRSVSTFKIGAAEFYVLIRENGREHTHVLLFKSRIISKSAGLFLGRVRSPLLNGVFSSCP